MLILRHASGSAFASDFGCLARTIHPKKAKRKQKKNDAKKSSFPAHGKKKSSRPKFGLCMAAIN